MKYVKDFRIFKKIIRKYNNRHCVKRIDYVRGKRFVSYWEKEDWIAYRVTNVNQLSSNVLKYIKFMVGENSFSEININKLLESNIYVDSKEIGIFNPDDSRFNGLYRFNGFILTNRDCYCSLYSEANKNEIWEYFTCITNLLKLL